MLARDRRRPDRAVREEGRATTSCSPTCTWTRSTPIVAASARRAGGRSYQARMTELERSVTARIVQLTRPGPVLLDLAVRGFGVRLEIHTEDNDA